MSIHTDMLARREQQAKDLRWNIRFTQTLRVLQTGALLTIAIALWSKL